MHGGIALQRQSAAEISVAPPLRLVWRYPGALIDPIVTADSIYAHLWEEHGKGIGKLDLGGKLLWKALPGLTGATWVLRGHRLAAVTSLGGWMESHKMGFFELDAETGAQIRRSGIEHSIDEVLPDRDSFLGTKILFDEKNYRKRSIAHIAMSDPLRTVWERTSREPMGASTPHDVYDDPCYAVGRVYVRKGGKVVCLDAGTGEDIWSAALEPRIGVLDNVPPTVVGGVVIMPCHYGFMAFDKQSGKQRWRREGGGSFTAVDGRLYRFSQRACQIIDAETGTAILERDTREDVNKATGNRPPQQTTHPAVARDHLFVGDSDGRLWAAEKDTGEVVWVYRPKDGTDFLNPRPQIVDNRLYIGSYGGPGRRPPTLYCYEPDR